MLEGGVIHLLVEMIFPFPLVLKGFIICETFKMYPRIKELITSGNYYLGQILRSDLYLLYETSVGGLTTLVRQATSLCRSKV